MTLGGNVCIRNGFALDYCWVEAVKSLLAICDEVVICDCDSEDATRQVINDWSAMETRINVVNFPWTDPKANTDWYPEWVNYSRQHLKTDWHIQLDADEVIHEDDHTKIKDAVANGRISFCKRLNFWRNPQNLIPEGVCCGTKVLRLAPTNMPIPSDYPYGPAEATMRHAVESDIRIFHYGFLRERSAFFRKAKEVQRIWANSYDPRLDAADKAGGNWMEHEGVVPWKDDLVPYNGTHPEIIKSWLRQRGHCV